MLHVNPLLTPSPIGTAADAVYRSVFGPRPLFHALVGSEWLAKQSLPLLANDGAGPYRLIVRYHDTLTADRFFNVMVNDQDATLFLPTGGATISGSSSGTNTGDQTNITGNAGTVTIANEATDTTCFPLFATAATGSLAPKTNAALTYNSNTGALGSTTFVGALTGNVTGNVTGSSGSCAGLAATATALATGRTIAMTGDVTWTSPSFDGSGNVTAAGTIGAGKVLGSHLSTDALLSAHSFAREIPQPVYLAGPGVWGTLPVIQGGTGQTSYTNGQLLIGNTTGNTLAKATLTAPAAGITITNGAGAITFALADDLSAVEALAATGVVARTAANTWSAGQAQDMIVLRDQQTSGTSGGTFTSGSFQTRTLNTEAVDTGNHCTLSSNQFTLLAGTYRIRAVVPAYKVDRHQARLQNVTDGTTTILGTSEQTGATTDMVSHSIINGRFTISASKTFEIQHRCLTTATGSGFGLADSFGTEVYCVVELEREVGI